LPSEQVLIGAVGSKEVQI